MRQDSKSEEKENSSKDVEKVNIVNLADKHQKPNEEKPQQQVNKLPQNEKMIDQQVANVKEQKNSETKEEHVQNELDDAERVVKKMEYEDSGKLFDSIKRFENQQKMNNKSSPASKKQLGVNEKRKSAPVKPEMIEDLSKIIYNKQSSLQDKE